MASDIRLVPRAEIAEMRRVHEAFEEIFEEAIRLGGTITGEHGVGVEKLNSMCVQFTAAENEQMFGVKRAFDPSGLLNPGKVRAWMGGLPA